MLVMIGSQAPKSQYPGNTIQHARTIRVQRTKMVLPLQVMLRATLPKNVAERIMGMKMGAGYESAEDGQQSELDEDELEEGETEDNEDEEEQVKDDEGEDEGEDEDDEDDLESEYDQEVYGTPVENLRPIQWRCLYLASLYLASCEEKVYKRLSPLQLEGGVPTFLSSVELVVESLSSASVQLPEDMTEQSKVQVLRFLSIPGILISLIEEEAFAALTLSNNAPREDWPKGLQAAADVVNDWGDLGVYNEDARPENVMLKKISRDGGTEYKAIAFDFAQARVRRNDESDQEWNEHKYKRGEEGAISAVVRGSRGLNLSPQYSWRTEGLGGTARYYVPEDDMFYCWGGGCTGNAHV